MVTADLVRELLAAPEHPTLDFKRDSYALGDDHHDSEFIKDVVSMANTPRDGAAYIVVGAKAYADGHKDLVGVAQHPDDNDLQTKFDRAKVTPRPQFVYQPVLLDGISYGVLEIMRLRDGPYFATKDLGLLKAHRLYFRSGTANREATIPEQGEIYRWFHSSALLPELSAIAASTSSVLWDEFHLACHHFEANRLFLLVVGQIPEISIGSAAHLGLLPFSLVLDFDPATDRAGLYHCGAPLLGQRRAVHLLTLDGKVGNAPDRACYWLAARGLLAMPSSLVEMDWRSWNRRCGARIQEVVAELARASGGRPLTVLSLWYAPEYLRDICGAVDRAFGAAADYVFAGNDADRLSELAKQFGACVVPIDLESIAAGVSRNMPAQVARTILAASVPTYDGRFRELSLEDLRWLSEDLDVIHSNVELEADWSDDVAASFLKGATISWKALDLRQDAERDTTAGFRDRVERQLNSRAAARFNLYHWPGAGGTTVARRIAWELRRKYPTVLIRRIVHGETVGRLRKLFEISAQTILALVEAAEVPASSLEDLFNETSGENIPVVYLTVLRRFETASRTTGDGQRTVFLGPSLNLSEATRFVEVYKHVAPSKDAALRTVLDGSPQSRTPFHFAIAALGRDYAGLRRYVESRLSVATGPQRDVLLFLSLAFCYGHRPVPAQLFATLLGLPENRLLRFGSVLGPAHLELLIEEGDNMWRPVHQIVAEEILHVLLSGPGADDRNWRWGLSGRAVEFIRTCRASETIPSYHVLDLIKRVLILRDERDLLGTESAGAPRFSRLIEEIPDIEGRLVVLKELVGSFHGEAHFWGHLGRFYSLVMNDPKEAIRAIDQAITLRQDDPVLYHMKGMCHRHAAYEHMKSARETQQGDPSKLLETVEKAKDAFEVARELDELSEHAHVSPAQLLLRVLDFGFSQSGQKTRAAFLVLPESGWYREQLDEVEYLLDRAKSLREAEKPSEYLLGCQASLDEVYDNYARALEGWTNLLTRKDVFAPPIRRQISRAYLARANRDWSMLPAQEINRIVDLMEDNMLEEPGSARNIRLWFRAYRMRREQDLDAAITKIAHWRALGDSVDAIYYLYILHVLKAIDGATIERVRSEELIEQSRSKARNLRNRTVSYEWFGRARGFIQLVHYNELGEWDENTDFYTHNTSLHRVAGVVKNMARPEAGTVELSSCGIEAFFVPARAGLTKGRDENARVTFHLAFSYEGLRAWNVVKAPESAPA